jgi:hypothetical protein
MSSLECQQCFVQGTFFSANALAEQASVAHKALVAENDCYFRLR